MLSQIMKLLPVSVAESEEEVTSAHINDLVNFYEDDLPTPSSIDTELHCWTVKWRGKTDEANDIDIPLKALNSTDGDFFLTSTLSVTSAECEHSVSRLQYLKTYAAQCWKNVSMA